MRPMKAASSGPAIWIFSGSGTVFHSCGMVPAYAPKSRPAAPDPYGATRAGGRAPPPTPGIGMPAPFDNDPKLAAYAHPERLVTTQWLADHADDPGLVIAESDEDVLLYDT